MKWAQGGQMRWISRCTVSLPGAAKGAGWGQQGRRPSPQEGTHRGLCSPHSLPRPLLPDAPEPSSVQISPLSIKEGVTVELACISAANPPPANYTWYFNGQEMLGKNGRTFQIPQVLVKHAGRYSCLAENSLGPGSIDQDADLDVQCE